QGAVLVKTPSLEHLHAEFLAIVPRIEKHGEVYFRFIRCSVSKEECIAEMVAMSWKWFIKLKRKGRNPSAFVSAIATFAAKAAARGLSRVVGDHLAWRAAEFAVARASSK